MSGTAAGRHAPIDPGLQGERTALAWHRTALAHLINGLLAMRARWAMDSAAVMRVAAIVTGCAVLTFGYASVRRRQLLQGAVPRAASPRSIAAIAGLTLLAGATSCGGLLADWWQQQP